MPAKGETTRTFWCLIQNRHVLSVTLVLVAVVGGVEAGASAKKVDMMGLVVDE